MNNISEVISPASFLEEEVRCDFNVTPRRKKLWQMEMELLQFVDFVCKKLDIQYYAIGGTLLGAVRHQGFIPWDDDIDLAMFRTDYDRFVKYVVLEMRPPIFVQCPDTEKDYALSHIKIRNSNSTGATKYDFEFEYNKGVFIDVFPLDNIPDGPEEKSSFLKGIYDYRKLIDVGARHFWYWGCDSKGEKSIVPDEEIKRYSDCIRSRTIPGVCKEYDGFCSKFNGTETEYCGILGLDLSSEALFWKRSWFCGPVRLPFEYLSIPCPGEYDAVLRKQYGDYLTFVRGGALHGSLIFEPDVPFYDYVLTKNPSFLI